MRSLGGTENGHRHGSPDDHAIDPIFIAQIPDGQLCVVVSGMRIGAPPAVVYAMLFNEPSDLLPEGESDANERETFLMDGIPPQLADRMGLAAAISRVRPVRRHIHRMSVATDPDGGSAVSIEWTSEASLMEGWLLMRYNLQTAPMIPDWRIVRTPDPPPRNPLLDFDIITGRPCTFGMSPHVVEEVNTLFHFQLRLNGPPQ